MAIVQKCHVFFKNANVPLYLDKRWQLWELGIQNCLFLQQKLITTEIYEGKIITQPWWCQCWRNFISIFWSLNGQLDAWNQDYLNEMWCQNICQAKVSSFIFKLSKFNFPISRSWKTWSFILTFLFWILANKLSSDNYWIHALSRIKSATSQSDCLNFFLAKHLASGGVWLANFEFWREWRITPLNPISIKIYRKRHNLLNKYRNGRISIPKAD